MYYNTRPKLAVSEGKKWRIFWCRKCHMYSLNYVRYGMYCSYTILLTVRSPWVDRLNGGRSRRAPPPPRPASPRPGPPLPPLSPPPPPSSRSWGYWATPAPLAAVPSTGTWCPPSPRRRWPPGASSRQVKGSVVLRFFDLFLDLKLNPWAPYKQAKTGARIF